MCIRDRSTVATIVETVADLDDDGVYHASIRFRYEVDGSPYWGWLERRLEKRSKEEAYAKLESQFPIGETFNVFYDPCEKEEYEFHVPTDKPGVVFLLVIWAFCLLMFGVSVWGIVYALSESAKL